ncbi:hypothetical protein ASG85_14275 [Paenibacillus sp. Soil724D2]|nr:hypothetical protein ASG85_14275 [Paenibacillus sp. Soil724D2]
MVEYHELTPAELSVCAAVFTETLKNDQETEMFYSYINAYWQRVETLKSFDEMLGKPKQEKVMSAEEMLSKVMGIHADMGGATEGR